MQHVYGILLRDLRTTLIHPNPTASFVSVSTHLPLDSPADVPRSRRPSLSPKKRRDTLATPSPQSSPTKPTRRKFSLAATPPKSPDRYTSTLDKLDATYSVWWECAELLIELGGRNGTADANAEADADRSDEDALLGLGPAAGMTRGKRPRAVTLGSDTPGSEARPRSTSGPPLASPLKPAQRRATTGRAGGKDLTPRQLTLLRGMLETDAGIGWDPRTAGVEHVRGEIEDDGSVRRNGKSGPGRGIRFLWRGLKKGTSAVTGGGGTGGSIREPVPRGSSSCDSSTSDRVQVVNEDGTGTSVAPRTPLSSKKTVTAADTAILSRRKQPTRRPSLAGIFGLGQKTSKKDPDADPEGTDAKRNASSSDWDRMDDIQQMTSTVRETKRLKYKGSFIGSSIHSPSLRLRSRDTPSSPDNPSPGVSSSPRVIVSSSDGLGNTPSSSSPIDSDTSRRKWRLRSANPPPRSDKTHIPAPGAPVSLRRLAFTPENIRPLLGHARDVMVHLNECINEVRRNIGSMSTT